MPKKSPTSRATAPRAKAKVVNNSKSSKTTSFLRSRWSALILVLAFVGVGIGTLTWVRAATETFTLWPSSAVPKTITDTDTKSVELGVKFKSQYAGNVTGVRFYKGPQNTGTHTGSLWTRDGRELARVTFKNETAGGWQTASFAQPIAIAANTTYIVSYHAPNGKYSANNDYFRTARTSGPLTAPKGNNGVYKYGSQVAFPTDTYRSSNYWVDVVFSTSRFFPTPKPLAPTELRASATDSAVNLVWKASATADVAKYNIQRDGNTIGTVASPVVTYTDTQVSVGKQYTYRVQAVDGAGTVSDFTSGVTVTVPVKPVPEPEEPNPNPNPDPNPTPTPGPVTKVCPDFPAMPDANCTGYKHSTGFTSDTQLKECVPGAPTNEAYHLMEGSKKDYSNCYFNSVRVRAKDVVFQNVKIKGSVLPPAGHHPNAYDYQNLKMIDVEITPFTDAQLDSFCPDQPGWWQKGQLCTTPGNHTPDPGDQAPVGDGDNLTCIRCYIHHHTKSAGGGSGVQYIDSFVDALTWTTGQHGAAIGFNNGVNSTIIHNNLRCYRWNTKHPTFQQGCSSALSIYDEGKLDGILVQNNMFNTGGVFCAYSGGHQGLNVRFISNIFGQQFNQTCGTGGPLHSWYDNPGYYWAGNVWQDGKQLPEPYRKKDGE